MNKVDWKDIREVKRWALQQRKQCALEVWNEVRQLMKPLPSNIKKEDLWIAGSCKTPEEYVLVNLRQKVLRKIDRLEKELS